MHIILVLGPQGSGKGTQASLLSKKLGVPTFSMGQLLRDAVQKGGPLANEIAELQKKGSLVSEDISIQVLSDRLQREDATSGYIIDGFPRNEEQFRAFDAYAQPSAVIVINLSDDVARARLRLRAEKEGRSDDTPEVIDKRLRIYYEETVPIIDIYRERGLVREIDGDGSIDEVADRIVRAFTL